MASTVVYRVSDADNHRIGFQRDKGIGNWPHDHRRRRWRERGYGNAARWEKARTDRPRPRRTRADGSGISSMAMPTAPSKPEANTEPTPSCLNFRIRLSPTVTLLQAT